MTLDIIDAGESSELDLPLLPLRDVVVFPHMVIPLFVGARNLSKLWKSLLKRGRTFCWSHKNQRLKMIQLLRTFTRFAVFRAFCKC